MKFLNPLAFIGLIAIPIIIIMYLLKQNYKSITVPSIQLWQKVIKQNESQKPWQKFRNNIIMLLQLLAALFIVLAMAKPYINSSDVSNYIIVLDSSMSMQATDEVPNRFEAAKKQIKDLIDSSNPASKISVVVMEKNPYVALNYSQNKKDIKNILKDINVTDTDIDLDMTASVINMLNQKQEANIYIFSDEILEFDNLDTQTVLIGKNSSNTSIDLLSHKLEDNKLSALVKVKNHSNSTVEQDISIYADGFIVDTQRIGLKANEQKDIVFDNLPITAKALEAVLENEDILNIDNRRFDTVSQNIDKKVLLLSNQNIFLEKALSILDIELYKGSLKDIEQLSGYNLYVFDGIIPDTIPTDGHILIINPPADNKFLTVGENVEVKDIQIKNNDLLKFATDINFSVSKSKKLEVPSWLDIIIDSEVAPLILFGENNGQKQVVFNFDLHDTDLPLKKEFPIFVYNLVNWYIPENITNKDAILAGETIDFNLLPNINDARVITPNNEIFKLAPPLPPNPFYASKAGIYTLEQNLDGETKYSYFAVNTPIQESNLLRDNINQTLADNKVSRNDRDIKNIFIVILLIILLVEWILYKNRNGLFKKRLIQIIRILSVLLIIIALFNPELKKYNTKVTTIFAVDSSDSIKSSDEDIKNFINEALKDKNNKDYVGIVGFGQYASLEKSITNEIESINFNSLVDKGSTNIEEALKLSSILMEEDSTKNIVLISDGQQNIGDMLKQSRILNNQNIRLNIYPIENKIDKEVQITEIVTPKYINKGVKTDITIKIDSLNKTDAVLNLYRNNNLISQLEVSINRGENRFIFTDYSDTNGFNSYKAELIPQYDTFKQNNVAYAGTYINDAPQILVLDNDDSGIEIENILKNSNIDVIRQNVMTAPTKISQLLPYSAIVLADVSVYDLPDNFLNTLESYVKTQGGGLLVTGGTNSYALGGYRDTVLEKILPVEMQLKNESEQPNLGMMIVADRSGSMGGGESSLSKIDLLKQAIIRSIDNLDTKDSLGIIAFDDKPIWISNFEAIGDNKGKIKDEVSSISLGGGTSILPALSLGYNTLVKADTKLKHIILITDGQAEQSGYNSLIAKMNENNITLSTIAIGQDADTKLLQNIASKGNGRYYQSTAFTDLPEIFAKETSLAGRNYVNNREFYPKLADYSAITEDINRLPILKGYISSVAKPRADIILQSDKDEPILASWQYGLGKTVAWTCDMDNNWSLDWLNSDEGVQIFKNAISSVLKNNFSNNMDIETITDANKTNLKVGTKSDKNIKSVKATITDPNLNEISLDLLLTQPEIYEAKFDTQDTGIYVLNIQVEYEDGNVDFTNSLINVNYSPEYDLRKFYTDEILLKKSAELTGGKIIHSPKEIFSFNNQINYSKTNIDIILLIIALILFLFEIAIRRFPAIGNQLELTLIKLGFILKHKGDQSNKPKGSLKVKPNKMHKNKEEPNKALEASNMLAQSKKKRMGR